MPGAVELEMVDARIVQSKGPAVENMTMMLRSLTVIINSNFISKLLECKQILISAFTVLNRYLKTKRRAYSRTLLRQV